MYLMHLFEWLKFLNHSGGHSFMLNTLKSTSPYMVVTQLTLNTARWIIGLLRVEQGKLYIFN